MKRNSGFARIAGLVAVVFMLLFLIVYMSFLFIVREALPTSLFILLEALGCVAVVFLVRLLFARKPASPR
ncbi:MULTISPECIES: hypothetical protein [Microbulbifer]|uniref:hypothetical protein n=1 Tax=Microbulbifer TaxID=48073 RepID=UPI000A8B03C0|nr:MULTISPECIES: hypothetical protein [Microbulbifer]